MSWSIAILKRDNFKCGMCSASIKDNKGLRLEVHHAKSFNDICKENNITTINQALTFNEMWSLDNGISLCYGCHKSVERIGTKLKNMFIST
jgi:5-methylcytosine-specific restriction endonuclease McrA